MPYDAARDFAGIALLGGAPMVLVCHPGVPARNMGELLALLRANPMRYNFAGAGIGSTVHLTGEVFRAAAEVQIQFVHYRGGGPALQAVMNGEAHLTAVSTAEALGQVRSGAVRALATSVPARSPVLPEVPTSAEAGLPGFQQDIWIVAARPGAHAARDRRLAERRLQRGGAADRAAAQRARAGDQGRGRDAGAGERLHPRRARPLRVGAAGGGRAARVAARQSRQDGSMRSSFLSIAGHSITPKGRRVCGW